MKKFNILYFALAVIMTLGITTSCEKENATLEVAPGYRDILFSGDGQTVTADNGADFTPATFTVTASGADWNVKIDQASTSWLTVTKGTEGKTFTLNASLNTGTEERVATVTVKAGNSPMASIRVTQKIAVPVYGISLSPSSLTLETDDIATLTASLLPAGHAEGALDNTLIWKSSDDQVVTVNADGVVTAVDAGTAKISVELQRNPSIKTEISITVTKKVSIVDKLQALPGLKGLWEFNAPDFEKATIGNDLQTYYVSEANNKTPGVRVTGGDLNAGIRQVAGFDSKDGAIEKDLRYMFKCIHNIPAGPSTSDIGEWTMMWDVKQPIDSRGKWCALLSNKVNNDADADLFISTNFLLGVGWSYGGSFPAETWCRVVAVMNAPASSYRVYLNEVCVIDAKDGVDSRFWSYYMHPLHTWICGDDNGDNHPVHLSTAAIFDRALSEEEISSLGGL